MGTLNGKGALVTGGSRGIGRAIVKRLAGDGASVVFSYVANTEAADRVVSEVTAAGGRALAVRADQGSLADLGRLSAQAEDWLDGLDIVVINAAGELPGMIDDVTEETYDRFMAVHAKGPFFLIQYAGGRLPGRPGLRLDQRPEPVRRRRLPALRGGGFAARSGGPRASNLG
jgi:3-oxoacyl-[acyl-carrier protein] reductase